MELTQNEIIGVSLEGEDESIVIETDDKIEDIVKALSSQTRRKILRQIQLEPADVSKIASDLDMTEANISAQIKKLEKAGLITCEYSSGAHGVRKISKLKYDRLVLKF
ncbi:MAG: ArsR/SmtB family transcription factor [Candidatus Hermodarchaeota archaeon]